MNISEDSKVERKLRRLEMARMLFGVSTMIAVVAVVLCGIDAFMKERDAWLAMRMPVFIAVLFLCSFAWSAKEIVALAAIRRR